MDYAKNLIVEDTVNPGPEGSFVAGGSRMAMVGARFCGFVGETLRGELYSCCYLHGPQVFWRGERPSIYSVSPQPRFQGLSSYRPLGQARRDLGLVWSCATMRTSGRGPL